MPDPQLSPALAGGIGPRLRRRSVLAGALAAAPLAALGAGSARAEVVVPAEGTAAAGVFTPGQPFLDTDGAVIQAHGGQVVVHEDASGPLYYWYGEDRTNGYASSLGVHVYSSRDLYSWTDEGLALRALESAEQLDSDPYFTALYAGASDEQRAAVIRDLVTVPVEGSGVPAAILERPKVLYNAAQGTWVMWVHADGPTETSTAQYAKANAGVAMSDSPTGPFRWIDSYRLHVAPADEDNYQPGSPGMARDMTLFLDDDGTAYIIYSSEENYSLFISKLDASFTYLATGPDDAVKGVDFTRPYIGAHREAPALFKRGGTYYLITSGATGWDPNPASYATATEILGEWTDHGNPCVGDEASTTFRSQSTNVIPVDPAKGTYIYMGDRWTPSDLANAPYIWLPLTFGEGIEMTLSWQDAWSWEDQPAQPAFTLDVTMPSYVRPEQPQQLPSTGLLHLDGERARRAKLSWDGELVRPGMVDVVATIAGTDALTARREVLVAPKKVSYLVSAGGAETDDYLALREAVRGKALLNSVADQAFGADPATGKVWGYEGRSQPAGSGTGSWDTSLRYATDHDDLVYRFTGLSAGTYTVHAGYYDPWPWANRAAQISINDLVLEEQQLFTAVTEAVAYEGILVGASGEIALRVHPTRSPDVQISWVLVEPA